MNGFAECVRCRRWAEIPEKFLGSIHFLKCTICHEPMYIVRNVKAADVGLRESDKICAGVMPHKGY